MSLKNWFGGGKRPPQQPNEAASEPSSAEPQPIPEGTGIPPTPVTLEDITRGMQLAASSANQLIAHQYMQALDPFFDHMDDGSLTPRTLIMQLDEKNHFELPLVALATPRGLMLEKMKVHLTVRTDGVEQLSAGTPSLQDNVSRFHVSLSPTSKDNDGRDSRHVDIEMQFTVLEPPESVMRLIEEYTNRVVPKPNVEESENE